MVSTNLNYIIPGEDSEFHPIMHKWIALEYIVQVDRTYHRPRLRINYHVVAQLLNTQAGACPHLPGQKAWDPLCPSVAEV